MTIYFVFGSNLRGRHGAGAALEAVREWGATYGKWFGPQGRSFAIPTKDDRLRTLSVEAIDGYVRLFRQWAVNHPEHSFLVTPIGCGLAGYSPAEIAPLFRDMPANVQLPDSFIRYLQ